MSLIQSLPEQLYFSSTVREGEKEAARKLNIPMFELMQRAGQSVFEAIQQRFTSCRHILVVCGKGNNGGDGYVVARLALQSGFQVTLWQVDDHQLLQGDAQRAKQLFVEAGGVIGTAGGEVPEGVDVIVDGILGTGITGTVRPSTQSVIDAINQSPCPVVSIDTPSGLDTDSGRILGSAVKADLTVTFISVKRGTVTGQARRCTGDLLFAGLGVEDVFVEQNPTHTMLTNTGWLSKLKSREQDSHKGSHGRLLVVGGGEGMSGAAYLASAAALRSGSGLVATQCHESSAVPTRSLLPEAMVGTSASLSERIKWCSVICLGIGLGRDDWGREQFNLVLKDAMVNPQRPIVIDADGLYWLSKTSQEARPWKNSVITPHPGEAAMLLNCDIAEVEADRYQAAFKLSKRFGCVTVLKGAGTLICDGETTVVCHAGNAGMATGGMGDVLAGVISSLLGQGYLPMEAATLGTLIHSMAADSVAQQYGQIGMLASDLLPEIRAVINHRTV